MEYEFTLCDRFEGTVHGKVFASSEEEALEEASIAGAELGCQNIDEIFVEERPTNPE